METTYLSNGENFGKPREMKRCIIDLDLTGIVKYAETLKKWSAHVQIQWLCDGRAVKPFEISQIWGGGEYGVECIRERGRECERD